MMTAQEGDGLLETAKVKFTTGLKKFAAQVTANPDGKFTLEFAELIEEHGALLRTMSNVIIDVHKKVDFYKDRNARVSMLSSINNLLNTSLNFLEMYNEVDSLKYGIPIVKVAPHSYDTIQLFLNSFHRYWQLGAIRKRLRLQKVNILSHFKKLKKPMNKTSRITLSVVVGAISIVLVVGILLMKENISPQLKNMLQTLFAIGCGGISAALIGTITLNKNYFLIATGTGGFAVFLIVFFIPSKISDPSFEMIITLVDSEGSIEPFKHGKTDLTLYNNGLKIPKSGTIEAADVYSSISNELLNKEVEMRVDPGDWVFKRSKKNSARFKIVEGGDTVVLIKTDEALRRENADSTVRFIARLVREGTLEGVAGASVRVVGSYEHTESKKDGIISLDISKKFHPYGKFKLQITLTAFEEYKEEHSYPASEDLKISFIPK